MKEAKVRELQRRCLELEKRCSDLEIENEALEEKMGKLASINKLMDRYTQIIEDLACGISFISTTNWR